MNDCSYYSTYGSFNYNKPVFLAVVVPERIKLKISLFVLDLKKDAPDLSGALPIIYLMFY